MPVEITDTMNDKFEVGFLKGLTDVKPMDLPKKILQDNYKQKLSGIVKTFQEICEHFKGKQIPDAITLSEFKSHGTTLDDANYITTTVEPFINTIKEKFKFDNNITLESVCEHIIYVLTYIKKVFNLNLTATISGIQKAYKLMTNKNAPVISLPNNNVDKNVKNFLQAQTLIKQAFENHKWGSSDLTKDGAFKDAQYTQLKKSLDNLNKNYQQLKTEGDTAYNRSANEIVTLYQRIKTFEGLKLDITVTKQKLDKQVQNFDNMHKGIQHNPYDTIKEFLKNVRNLEKGTDQNNAGLVIITKDDAKRRLKLLQGKHWNNIQKTFFDELIGSKKSDFKTTSELIKKCLIKSQKLEQQLSSSATNTNTIKRPEFNTLVQTYFTNKQEHLYNIPDENTIDINFEQLKKDIDQKVHNWEISQDVVYCIGYIYIQLSSFVNFLNEKIQTATQMLKTANGTLDKKDASNLKFGFDIYGKFATVAAFTGPLVQVSPIFAGIWGAIALTGTIVQIVQVVYNHHQAKKTAQTKQQILESQREPEKHDETNEEPESEQQETGEETKKTIDELTSQNNEYKKEIDKLKKQIDELKRANKRLSHQNAVTAN